jgi:putative FmdB family regulatory protein
MPIYEYRCENGHVIEVMQKITDDPVTKCTECGAPVQRVFHPIAVHFKGSGFYNTDYGTAKRKRETDKAASAGADKHDAKASEKKADSKPDSKPSPSTGSAD